MTGGARGALLFDIDGTLTDTDPLHLRAFNAMLAEFGMSVTHEDYLRRVMGFTNARIMREFFPDLPVAEHRRLADLKEAAFRDLAAKELRPTAGLLSFMDWTDAAGIAMAAVTNAPRRNAELMLDRLGIAERFRALVIGDELERGKPDPLPYLTAADRLGVRCDACIAFEDSRSGLRSASSAGAYAIGVMSSLGEKELIAAGARLAVRDFADARLQALAEERLLDRA